MDTTPLDPSRVSLAVPEDTRGGSFYTATPHHRSTHRTAFLLRVASILFSLTTLCLIAYTTTHNDPYYPTNWAFGSPTAILALVWSILDIAVRIGRDRGLWWRHRHRARRSRRFSFGPPGLHVTAHLGIWLGSAVLSVFLWLSYAEMKSSAWYSFDSSGGYIDYALEDAAKRTCTIAVFHLLLPIVHFVLFVFACIAADDEKRKHVDVVFVPKEDLREFEKVPPATLFEVVRRKRLPIAYYANHSVRYEPGADGTVQMLRDYSSRQLS
ncbi:hypothetical protein ACHAQH_008059 [Verticillium albo-atrum]